MRKSVLFVFCSLFVLITCFFVAKTSVFATTVPESIHDSIPVSEKIYNEMQLKGVISYTAFVEAYNGYVRLNPKNKDILTVIDYSLPSTEKRLFVLDLNKKQLVFSSIVSHGRNSGENYATSFSNKDGSHKSSLGFFITENTYMGGNGYSLVLNGLEKGFNDKAKSRAVVIHGADYCSTNVIKASGRLGRSWGCPALPRELNKPIIDYIKNGSLIYIYADDETYRKNSPILASAKITKETNSNTVF